MVLVLVFITANTEFEISDKVSGQVVLEAKHEIIDDTTEKIANYDETLEINKGDLTECCSFFDDNGKEKVCFALNNFNCDYCNTIC